MLDVDELDSAAALARAADGVLVQCNAAFSRTVRGDDAEAVWTRARQAKQGGEAVGTTTTAARSDEAGAAALTREEEESKTIASTLAAAGSGRGSRTGAADGEGVGDTRQAEPEVGPGACVWSVLGLQVSAEEKAQYQDGGVLKLEKRFVQTDGPNRWLSVSVRKVRKDPSLLLVQVENTTRSKLAADRVEAILELSFDGFWDWYMDRDYEYMSPVFWEHFGYRPEEKEHRPSAWENMIFKEDLQVALGNLEKHVASRGEHPYLQEVRYRHKDGSTVWVLCKGHVVEWGEGGEPLRMMGSHTNITKVKRQAELTQIEADKHAAERAKAETLNRELTNLMHTINAPIFATNKDGLITEWNKATEGITGKEREEVLQTPLQNYISKDYPNLQERVKATLNGEPQSNLTVHLRRLGNEREVSLLCNLTPQVRSTGEVVGALILGQDLSEIQEARAQALRATERAATEKALNEFLAHEFRNPLTGALAASRFAQEDLMGREDTERNRGVLEDIQIVHTSLEYMSELLTNMFDLGRHESKEIELHASVFSIRDDILEPAVHMLSSRASGSLPVSMLCPDALVVKADLMRLRQVIINIASNAVKFTTSGFVRLSAYRPPLNPKKVVIAVEDTGPPITAEDQKQLFQKWTPFATSSMRGGGFGFCLSQRLVQQMGGSLALDASYDSGHPKMPGCRFEVVLDLPVVDPERGEPDELAKNTAVGEVPHECKVLIVDDDMIVRATIKRRLKRICPNWSIEEAINGEEAISKIKSSAEGSASSSTSSSSSSPSQLLKRKATEDGDSNNSSATENYDLIIVDNYMPLTGGVITGEETIKQAREIVKWQAAIVGISGNDKSTEHLSAGANLFWQKPLPTNEVIKSDLGRILFGGAAAMSPRGPSTNANISSSSSSSSGGDMGKSKRPKLCEAND
ncbi:Autoinducer 2 sensor kinase/phosphatase LuxQ [Durusdinium trenchii]|uniref:histidine kinase n=1 Tax=Durusdinium trenchii TaxID=1381693 RepID=A0ABP0IMQ6_9DINO